jgi:hypothetical protein
MQAIRFQSEPRSCNPQKDETDVEALIDTKELTKGKTYRKRLACALRYFAGQ